MNTNQKVFLSIVGILIVLIAIFSIKSAWRQQALTDVCLKNNFTKAISIDGQWFCTHSWSGRTARMDRLGASSGMSTSDTSDDVDRLDI